MSESTEPTEESAVVLPAIRQSESITPALALRPWYLSAAPTYLGLFVWGPFFDQLWIGDLARDQPPWLVVEAFIASALCFSLFYLPLATWGLVARRPLIIVASSTFGTTGSEWIVGVGIAIASIVWFAVALTFAVDSTLLGLHSCGLIDRSSLSHMEIGGVALRSPVFLATALFWIYITGMSSLWKLTGVVVALMRVYAPVAFVLLTATALWILPNLRSFRWENAAIFADAGRYRSAQNLDHSAIQLVLGFFAMAGLICVDWGAVTQSRRDNTIGGVVGVMLASFLTSIMALIVVAGAVVSIGTRAIHPGEPLALSFRWAVLHGIGGYRAGLILILFGLAALAPACYSVSTFGLRLSARWPRIRHSQWTWLGGAMALILTATSSVDYVAWIFIGMGCVFAPAVGAMLGDMTRQRSLWHGVRAGINPPGVIAWGVGCGMMIVLEMCRTMIPGRGGTLQPTPLYGLLASATVYWLLASRGLELTPVPIDLPRADR